MKAGILLFSLALTLGVFGCKSHTQDASSSSQKAAEQQAVAAEPQPAASSEKAEPQANDDMVYMPDYYKVRRGTQSKVSFPSSKGVASARPAGETSSPITAKNR